ncbi:hypothetical protein LTR72_010802 [Exophiala xenobiotica]|nr:hypothetical protein LTR92_007819 [Exophiala xenobiotica]KAK5216231.1 hypothetical protein LTR72_010802 [Exophiala xenobiotica]KAK5285667.1 hypothetical protein LTR14_010782 [Exophiala xenobiotica]KAK5445749.1 hypothetical protein LTR18_003668 [Exophiala xenobiotica]KAK5497608.1 hypothetical protein LTR55_002100 [Exophiala xenobiotica]
MPSHLGQTHSASLNLKTRLGGEIPPSPPKILPLFASPRPSDHKEPKKTWVGSASKRLRFPKLREKASFAKEQTPPSSKKDQIPKSSSTRKLIIGPKTRLATPDERGQPNAPNRPHRPSPSPSPTDKPLPSLPVAIVKYKSPVRRSLIDCSERPLRRSISPPDGGPPKEEDWPSMQPSSIAATDTTKFGKSLVKPSLGESIIEGMRGLNLEDKKDQTTKPLTPIEFGNSSLNTKGFKFDTTKDGHDTRSDATINPSGRPLSSSQLPKPRDSMLQSLSRHTDSPVVRQTKTSAMRLQSAVGKRAWSSGEKRVVDEGPLPSIYEQSPLLRKSRQVSGGGPIRSASRGRHGVTPRGSPYTIPSRSMSRSKTASPANVNQTQSDTQSVVISVGFSDALTNGTGGEHLRKPSAGRDTVRRSSIPIPSRMHRDRVSTGSSNVSAQQQTASNSNLNGEATDFESDAPLASSGTAGTADNHELSDYLSGSNDKYLSIQEALSTPAARDDESVAGSNYSSGTIRGYDAFGGFRVKRLGHGLLEGPTLRITDSARGILLGDEQAASSPPDAGDGNVILRRKRSAPDLGRRLHAIADGRRNSAMFDFERPLSFVARNITDSSCEFKALDDDEVRKLIEDNTSAMRSEPAELQGSEVELPAPTEAKSNVVIAEETLRESHELPRSPASTQCDWPGKDFAEFNLCSSPTRSSPTKSKSSFQDAEVMKGSASAKSVSSRPSTIVLRAPPSKEIAPFLFQDHNGEPTKTTEQVRGMGNNVAAASRTPSADSSSNFPPRTSSRKPKPPPIIVSPPSQPPSLHRACGSNVQEVDPDSLKKHKNVKTFSQSMGSHTDSIKTRRSAHKLGHSPSSSSKKVISNIRGLFHKRSVESPAESSGSIRRKPVPNDKFTNPLSLNPPSAEQPGEARMFHYPNRGARNIIRNPFISPTTPFTATVKPSPSPYPGLHAARHPSPGVQQAQSPSETLSNATTLTHSLLDLAHTETDVQRKTHLIQMSKCMVEVVSAARDAEKAMEKAKMEAARAEVSWLKVQKEVGSMMEAVLKFDTLERKDEK